MTAEIAVLNKTAVALAADSAVTISAGHRQEKIFDTADKLFELSLKDPIGIMIYNGMSFMGIPLPVIIKEFRSQCVSFEYVRQAGEAFLKYLHNVGIKAPASMHADSIEETITPVLVRIRNDFQTEFMKIMFEPKDSQTKNGQTEDVNADQIAEIIFNKQLSELEERINNIPPGNFVGGEKPLFAKSLTNHISKIIESIFEPFSDVARKRISVLVRRLLVSKYLSSSRAGLVIAGFGRKEKFPTLIAYEIDGMVARKLKYNQRNFHDIDREGDRAVVLPFAQKEMVDRFLYGLDDDIQRKVVKFCRETVPSISNAIIDNLTFEDEQIKNDIISRANAAQTAFITNLQKDSFNNIVASSKKEIEDMVEFMPKPELAKMAEALIDLTRSKEEYLREWKP